MSSNAYGRRRPTISETFRPDPDQQPTAERKNTSVWLPMDVWRDLRRYAFDHDTKLSEVVTEACRAFLDTHRD